MEADTSNANANSWNPWASDTSKFETPVTSDPLAGRYHGVEPRGRYPTGYRKRDDRDEETHDNTRNNTGSIFQRGVNKDNTRNELPFKL